MSSSEPSAETDQPFFQIQNVYLKDLSLEQPNSPAIFLEREMPSVQVSLNVSSDTLAQTVFEVRVTVTVTAKAAEKTAYLVEGTQAGIFEIRNLPEGTLDQVLFVNCAAIVYPYLRANIDDMVRRAGFPPVHLAEINFEAFFREKTLAEQSSRTGEDSAANGASASDSP
ncbi:MAG: protein-export chaperone SecB [Burkholderiaceae bacterium]|jgi:preprotein translocase subunit SecB|nr:protein-export chaperone SecB [Burkholderiaceae bacterium]